MDLSIIIVNYNVRHFLEQCLNSVLKASENTRCEIFIVDNNSTDGSCQMISGKFPGLKLIRNTENNGFSAANNQAIRQATGRFILLLNPDTLIEEETITRCLAFMDKHNDCGALGVRMINGNGKLLPESKRAIPTPGTAFFKMSGLSFLFPHSKLFNRYYLGHLDSSAISETEIISGAFMFIRKEVLEKTGLLDETFFMYGEDIDLSYRILKAGYKNYYFPEARIIHYKGESTSKSNINYVVQFYKAMLIFAKKHFSDDQNKSFLFVINVAVYFWGFIAVLKNFLLKILIPLYRLLMDVPLKNPFKKTIRSVIIGNEEAMRNIKMLFEDLSIQSNIVGRVSIKPANNETDTLGSLDKIRKIIKDNRINEVIFSGRELTVSQLISSMHLVSEFNVRIRISPPGENLVIGSKSVINKS